MSEPNAGGGKGEEGGDSEMAEEKRRATTQGGMRMKGGHGKGAGGEWGAVRRSKGERPAERGEGGGPA